MSEPIRIFVGTSETEDKWIERILVYTLLQNTDVYLTYGTTCTLKNLKEDGRGSSTHALKLNTV